MKKYIYLFILCLISFFLVSCKNNSNNNQNDDPIFVKTYLIIFDGNGGTLVKGSENQSVEDPSQIVAPTYEKEGYEFDGWSVDLTNITTDKMVYAKWKEIVVVRTVTFDANGGEYSGKVKEEISNGKLLIEPDEPSMIGYTFEGWFNGEVKWDFKNDAVTKNLTLKAHYKINQYNITLKYNDGVTEDKVITQDYYTKILINNPTRVGYTFDGWSEVIETMPSENKIIEASWKINQYTITIKYNDGVSNDKVITQDYGTDLLIEAPTREGYTFVKWSEDIQTMPAENKTIEASWKINEYLLTIKYNDGVTKDKIIRLDYNEKIIIDNPTKVGYTFDKWSESVPERMPDRNVTLEAVWKINQYTLTVQFKDGVTEDLVLTQDYETAISINVPSRTGYTFNNWSEEFSTMPAENKTIEASWICDVKYYIQDEKVVITGFNKDNNIVILDYYEGYETTEIGNSAFINCAKLVSIVLPDTVKTIGESAFLNCSLLSDIQFKNVTTIGDYAFYKCSALANINLENVTAIGKDAFHECSKLSSISLPACLTIDNYAFTNCTSLTKVENLNKLTNIGESSFSGCSKLACIDFPKTLIEIGGLAFNNCVALESIATYENLTTIGSQAFSGCTALTSINIAVKDLTIDMLAFHNCTSLSNINFSTGSLIIGKQVFKDCTSLVNIVFPEGLASIGDSLFEGCSVLSNVSLPSTLAIIGESAFSDCTALSSITMKEGLQTIGANAFANCILFESLTIPTTVSQIGKGIITGCSSIKQISIPFIGSSTTSTENGYLSYLYGGNKYEENETLIPSALTKVTITGNSTILDNTFNRCSGIKEIVFQDTIPGFGVNVLKDCSSLISLTIPYVQNKKINPTHNTLSYFFGGNGSGENKIFVPSSLKEVTVTGGTEIAPEAFKSCDQLLTVNITGALTAIYDEAFKDCTNLTSITLPNTITEIKAKAFSNCITLTNINWPTSLKKIYTNAFYNCSSLVEVTLPVNVLTIENSAFNHCTSLTTFICNENLAYIGNSAFEGCSALSTVGLDCRISILYGVFKDCTSLKSITLPNTLDSVYAYAFSGCTSLKTVNFNDNLTVIGGCAFSNCALETLTLPNKVTSIEAFAFEENSKLKSVTIPNSVQLIESGAFYDCNALESISLPFVGSSMNATSKNNFGYIFGASSYSYNKNYIPNSLKTIIIRGGTTIPDSCFSYMSCAANVTLEGIQTIGFRAFYSCESLISVTILNSITSIGSYAFSCCNKLSTIVIPEGLSVINKNTFEYCTSLTSITLPSSLNTIGELAFYHCELLSSITIKEGLLEIGAYAFERCKNLTQIDLPSSLTTILSGAFYNCENLSFIVIPYKVEIMESYVFYGCDSLAYIGCEAKSKPSGWDIDWNSDCDAQVIWYY